jgi:hypothetical protein
MGVREGNNGEMGDVILGIRVQLALRPNELWELGWGTGKDWWLLPTERLRSGNIGPGNPDT